MNVLVLVVDSLRRDYCHSDITDTPTIDNLREESVTFDQCISGASMTPASMGSIFSGIYPHQLDMYNWSSPYPDDLQSLFGLFDDAGYEVGSFVFDENYLFSEVEGANVVDNFRDFEKPQQWVKDHTDDDFFMFVHHYWVHGPYEPQESAEDWSRENEEIRRELRTNHEEAVDTYSAKYADAVEQMSEHWLEGLLDTFKEEGILDDTLVVFTADHGESWGERYEDKSVIQSNYHLHGELLYDELIRVPLVLRYPDELPEDETVDSQVRHIDIFPTIAEMAGLDADDGWERRGTDLREHIAGDAEPEQALCSAPNEEMSELVKMAVRNPQDKLIWNIGEETVEYYDLDSDPDEQDDLSDQYPDRVHELKTLLEDEVKKSPSDLEIEGAEEIKNHLKDLGYL